MSNYPAIAAEAGDKYLAALADGQDRIIEYVRASREFIPPMPMNTDQSFGSAQFAMPSMKEMANFQFQFATKLLEQQRKFLVRLYGAPATRPAAKAASRSASGTGAKPRRASAPRAAKKATAKSAPTSTATK